ncbi:MAG: EamA family transporter [Chromatiaceae bacterium]|nr:EamA family transporter [Gammaproteobacteria bacterium]MCP5301325.1 EamA family transporter [Chromatiaceae bacterium]MCP5421909.1 EamA family transporter [Chromatiaceae bacterium]
MHWLILSLICAFTLASSDAAAKHWLRDAGAREMVVVRLGLSGLLLIPWVLTFDLPPLPPAFWGWMSLLVPLEIIAMLMYMQAIRDYPLALTLPYLAFTPVLVVLTGWLVLGETVSGAGLFGILLVVAGSWLLNFTPSGPLTARQLIAPLRAIVVNRGSRLMLATAGIYAVTSVGGKAAMQWMPPEHFGAFYFAVLGSAVLLLMALTRPRSLRVARFGMVPILVVAGLMALMVVTHFMALAQVEAAYMIAVKRTSLLFGMVYGAVLFGERHLGRHLLAGIMMVAGVVAIGL